MAEIPQSLTVTIVIVLEDPCDPPLELTKPNLTSPDKYTVSTDAKSYIHDLFTVNPSYCPV